MEDNKDFRSLTTLEVMLICAILLLVEVIFVVLVIQGCTR